MKILFAATEAHPFIRTGGLGDVIGSLPEKIAQIGNDVRVIIPKYSVIKDELKAEMKSIKKIYVKVGWRNQYCGIEMIKHKNVTFYFVDNEYYFKRDGELYGHYDDAERFAFFDRAVLEILKEIDWCPDIINCNDWHCGMIPALFKLEYVKDKFYKNIKIVFTIHNILFQGIYSKYMLSELFGYSLEQYDNGQLKFDEGCISFMKGGIVYADKITTVSESYSEEIKTLEYGERLDEVLRYRDGDLIGIVNGIDYDEYNPKSDKYILKTYDVNTIEDKSINKVAMQKELGLNINKEMPIIALISRLTNQKGIDLIMREVENLVVNNDVQIVILGTGDKNYENYFSELACKFKGQVATIITFDTALSHRIYAGADMFLMPSKFEPCGLGQLIALRYGTVPIVRETGGLRDTIEPYNEYMGRGNGFSFKNYYSYELMNTILYALEIYKDKESFKNIVSNAMSSDNSWDLSAIEYLNVYNFAMGK